MKQKHLLLIILMAFAYLGGNAQNYKDSRYYNPGTKRLDYSRGSGWNKRQHHMLGQAGYFGLRIGATFSTINSDNYDIDSDDSRTGLNIMAVAGIPLSHYLPMYLETGLQYNEKGGKQESVYGDRKFNLNYIEVPIVVKYSLSPNGHFAIQPYAGGYLACGVGGKVKDFSNRQSYEAFGDHSIDGPLFNRFDGGLKIGCGVSYDVLYADMAYEYGLANISDDSFDSVHNSSFMLTVGVNF